MTEHHDATEATQPGFAVWWPRRSVLGVPGCCNDFPTELVASVSGQSSHTGSHLHPMQLRVPAAPQFIASGVG